MEDIYFFISYEKNQKEDESDIDMILKEKNELKCIYVDEKYEDQIYYCNRIFKIRKSAGKREKGNNYYFEFQKNDDQYILKFDSKGSIFIYDVILEVGKKMIEIRRKINHNKEYYKTIEFFIKALKKNGEENLIDILYKETIELYSMKEGFTFMIELFLKIYQKKNLCIQLLQAFKKINQNSKDMEKNKDRKIHLKDYISKFNSIKSEADKIIKDNNYNYIEFYGVVLCYLNYYDYESFISVVNELYNKKPEDLYEILLIYNAHFKPQINQEFGFYNKFIPYAIANKDFSIFEKGLKYIQDIETFLNIIANNKEAIFEKYNSKKIDNIIKLDYLQFKKYEEPHIIDVEGNEAKDNSKNNNEQCKEDINSNDKKYKSIMKIIENIKSIIVLCKDKKTFLIYFTNNFWKYTLNYYNDPSQENIYICFKLREIFIEYHDLIIKVFEKEDTKFTIKKEAINYFERDEFAFILDQIIKKYINNKEIENIEKLAFITKYNPYYIEPKYSSKVDCRIFDYLDLNSIDNEFIEDFKQMNFEYIFRGYIAEYIKKFIDKVKDISNFYTVIKLINIKNIKNKNIYLDSLKKGYDNIVSNEIGLLTEEKLNEAIHLVAKIAIINYSYESKEPKEKKFEFINKRINKLDNRLILLIYIEIINLCFKDEEKEGNEDNIIDENQNKIKEEERIDYKEMKNFIFENISKKLANENDIDNFINLLDFFEGKDKKKEDSIIFRNETDGEKKINEFVKQLMEQNLFTKDEFFSSSQNLNILLIYKLFKKGKIQKKEEEYYENLIQLLDEIKKDIEGNIKKSKLEEFLKNEPFLVKQRLSLIKIILEGFNPEEQYEELKRKNDEINKEIEELKNFKDNIILYFKDSQQDLIKSIIEVLKTNQNKRIIEYYGGRIRSLIQETKDLKDTSDKINKVKDFLLFNVIYDNNTWKNENQNFESSYETLEQIGEYLKDKIDINELNNKYKRIFQKIKEKLSNNEEEANKFFEKLKDFYQINNTNLFEELTIFFKSKKYELDINSIIFFFKNYFQKDNKEWNDKLPPRNYVDRWESDYKNIKEDLNRLKENKIYDYQAIKNYNKLFTCLYNEKEAIDFLISKTSEEILKLKNKIQPNDRTINIKDIIDTEKCVFVMTKMKEIEDNFKILEYIQSLGEETISQFEKYSKIYSSVIELDSNDENSDNAYNKVVNIIRNATFIILQDSEYLLYYNENNERVRKDENIMEELIHLKNQIHIKNETENNEDDIIKSKCKILIFFKDIISDLILINEYMKILRKKGSSLPIEISIDINIKDEQPTIKYYIGKEKEEECDFKRIRDFLFEAQNTYISQLGSIVKEKSNLRFLYGKQFRTMMKHLEENYNIDSFLRYIINNSDNNKPINEGYKTVIRHVNDYIKRHDLYNRDSLDSISSYITSLFENNNKTLEDHYTKIKIIPKGFKGIYLLECENKSMEEDIINLFWDKIKSIPIAQNILITNKETSSEEIQAFFHRAILCNYNTLFVVELNDSFSEFQQNIMIDYIDNLLSYKNNQYNEEAKKNTDKISTNEYLDSCIAFIYDSNKNKNITPLVKEIKKYINQEEDKRHIYLDEDNIYQDEEEGRAPEEERQRVRRKSMVRNITATKLNISSKVKYNDIGLNNILIMTSDICGLGKSEKIKKMIKEKNKVYFHFPLGGILTKSIIFNKLEKIINEIDIEIKKNNNKYGNIAIHLDLTESEEASIINEFFFSFLITRFYTNNENVIYIPKDIHIYIEVPNCFENYLSKFSILKIFNKENITFENMPPFNCSDEIINIFRNILGIRSNEGLKDFVKKYIGIPKYSYHQVNIFVKLFISHYSNFKLKLQFIEKGKDVTAKSIQDFSNFTNYFTNGRFAQLLTGIKKINNKNFIDILSEIYENDLSNIIFPSAIKEKRLKDKLNVPIKDLNELKSSEDYLKKFIEIFELPYETKTLLPIIEEKNNNYVITNDNFKKMVLLIYRIKANIPVIIMGETGCGKTLLIKKLNQILNGGETTLKIINIHPGITDETLCEKMKEANEEVKTLKEKGKDLWVFFDNMNNCLSLTLLTEIFINRKYNGKKISENIRLIGACNPYRKRKRNKEKIGLRMPDDNDNKLVYLVHPLPQSLLYYVLSFGIIDVIDEKKYINSFIEKLFTEEEKKLHERTRDAISQCHIYLRDKFDPSVISLRDIIRFTKCIIFFQNYFKTKSEYEFKIKKNKNYKTINKKNNKLRSIICSIYLCYYIRLANQEIRFNFETKLRDILLNLVNNDINIDKKGSSLMEQIKNKSLKNEIEINKETIIQFSDFLNIEQNYLIEQIELENGIGKNALLKENVFLLFLSIITNIPLIIIGKPSTGKSLSAQLIYKSMRGKYSKNKFFTKFPQIFQTYFQGSESSQPEDVQNLFDNAGTKLKNLKEKRKKEDLPIIMVLFDELGLAGKSQSNPLKVLYEKIEYIGKEEGLSFIGISNYSLDASKINRALVLSVQDLDQKLEDLIETSQNIVESISDRLKKETIFKIIAKTYFKYKQILQLIKELVVYKQFVENEKKKSVEDPKNSLDNSPELLNGIPNNAQATIENQKKPQEREKRQFGEIKRLKDFIDLLKKDEKVRRDFHGNQDFYNLIRGIAIDLKSGEFTDNEKVAIIIKNIERNFGGIEYELDLDLKLVLNDIENEIKLIKNILKDYELYEENKKVKLSSVFLFKKLYNLECEEEKIPKNNLKIGKEKLNDYNLNKCINDNIKDVSSRYLLLEIKPSLSSLIYHNIKLQTIKDITLYEGSPFPDDNKKEYRFKIINKIKENAKEDKLIIIENLNQIHPFLFDLYNRNYITKENKKYVRICLENFNDQLTLVNEKFRVIILVDIRLVNKCDLAFLNRLEKMVLSFDKLLDNKLKILSNNLINEIKLKNTINKYNDIKYSLKDLLINCRDENIQALIYYFSKESQKIDNEDIEDQEENKLDEEKIRENVINKIYKMLPQDIFCILKENNIIRKYYNSNPIFCNYNDYVNDKDSKKYKISIIYTFTSIANIVKGLNKGMSFMVSEIRSEDGLKRLIDEIKNKNDNNKYKKEYNICINFEQSNSKKIKFISNFILENFKDDNYNYIFIIHINRNFNKNNNERIYSIPDINPSINQMFIDNLNGNSKILLKDLLAKDIKEILNDYKEDMKLDEEFNKTLINTLDKELSDKDYEDNIIEDYIIDAQSYMNEEETIKNKIIEVVYKLIDNNKEQEINCIDIIDKLYTENINIYTIDIASYLIEYIKDIFNEYITKILLKLEDNNILTTLIELKRKDFKEIEKSLAEEITKTYLDEIAIGKNEIKPETKFLFNYIVPGLYNFYKDFSKYIKKYIISNYFNNEKKLRESLKADAEEIKQFHNMEYSLLNNVNNYIDEYITKNKIIFEVLNKIPFDLIFKDYFTLFLQNFKKNNYFYSKDEIYLKLIELLLKLRFKEEKDLNGLIMKIIWIESNANYILNIFKIIENAIPIFKDSNKFYNKIEELIFKNGNKIKYITNENKNPEITREVNECFYILLSSICYSIISDEIELTLSVNKKIKHSIKVNDYYYMLKNINKILQILNDDLNICLNEMYIIDELIKIIEIFGKKKNIEKINEIKNLMKESAFIIQKYNNNEVKLNDELIKNFEEIYNSIIKDEVIGKDEKDYFYDKIRYILLKEIKKIPYIDYRYKIVEKLLESNEMIRKSNDIFQILLKDYIKKDYKLSRNIILNGDDDIIELLDKTVNNNYVLAQTLLYFFEKNALNYLDNILNSKKEIINDKIKETVIIKLEDEPLDILKDCYEVLNFYIFEPKKLDSKLKEIGKLYCLGYIKSYIHTFVKTFEDEKPKFNDPNKIINAINGDNPIYKMIRIYIYKILSYNFGIYVFINKKMIEKYKLNDYKNFKEFIQVEKLNNIYKIENQIRSLKDDYYEQTKKTIEKYLKNGFKNPIRKNDFDIEEFSLDNFYIISYNLILSNLQAENSDYNPNFFKNICEPLFKEDKLLFKAIELFFNPIKYKAIKENYKIDAKNIKAILFGYRYCLNELSFKKSSGIYYGLYDMNNYKIYLKEQYYPGNDSKPNSVYSSIINHFKTKPNEGCYVCLCKKGGHYHSVISGFPGFKQLNMTCPKCSQKIGATKKESSQTEIIIVKRDDYYRIFRDEKEIEELKKDKDASNKLGFINYMTFDEYKKKFTNNENEKGILINNDKYYFKNDKKIIRNLSQISFRILNYILYSHLFFANLITNKKEDFKKYLPNMSWAETLNECWNSIQKELAKENIDSIEKFMSYIFSDLFPILNKEEKIDNYESLIKFEDELESNIKKIVTKYKEDSNKYNIIKDNQDKTSPFNLLKEKYTSSDYSKEEFPFYEYFYYTDYLNEKYITENLAHMNENKYPLLKYYLDFKNNQTENNSYSFENLNLFNSVLNLINETYFNKISREDAEKKKLKEEEIYANNKDLIDKFITFCNDLKTKYRVKLSIDNPLSDFLLDGNTKFGINYKNIYKNFAKEQNEKLGNLLDKKIKNGIFDIICKNRINIQQINEKELFTLSFPKEISFIDILFNSSYRRILDSETRNNELYKEYKIEYNLIEENMTELLLKNKKLLNDEVSEFSYRNKIFSSQVSNLITLLKKRYNTKNLFINDKVAIYKFYNDIKNNSLFCKNIIKDFIELIKYLNEIKNENNDKAKEMNKIKDIDIKEETKIYEVVIKLKDTFSINFIKLFENNDGLTIDKTPEIFLYYLKLIFELVKDNLKDYQNELDNKSKELIKDYYKNEHLITKKDFSCAIRLFTTLVLFFEEDKENKIKLNKYNIIKFLKASDLWNCDIYNNNDFNRNLNELKLINIQINQSIYLYEALGKDIEPNFVKDVLKEIEKNEKVEEKPNSQDGDDKDEEDIFAEKKKDDDDDEFIREEI